MFIRSDHTFTQYDRVEDIIKIGTPTPYDRVENIIKIGKSLGVYMYVYIYACIYYVSIYLHDTP